MYHLDMIVCNYAKFLYIVINNTLGTTVYVRTVNYKNLLVAYLYKSLMVYHTNNFRIKETNSISKCIK